MSVGCRAGLSEPRREVWAPVLPVPTTGVLSGSLRPHLWGWREIGLGSNNISGTFLPGWYMFIQQMSPGHQLGAGAMVVSKTDRPCPQRIKVRKKQANSHLAVATRCHGALLHPLNLTRLCPSRSPNPAPSPLAQIPTLNPSPSPAPATLSFTWRPEWPFFF